jgi:signal transduction histidine kinase/ActR/RegA family two-component response regulator
MDPTERIRSLEARLQTLSDTVRAFAEATSDYERLFQVVAQKLSEVVKDGCVLRLLSDDGFLTPVAIHLPIENRVSDEATRQRLREHVAAPRHLSEQASARRVIETGEPLLVPVLDLAQLRASASPDVAHAFETIGIHSLLFVALRVRGASIGLLALVRFETDVPFSESDAQLAQALADHAALSIDNGRLLKSALHELSERELAEKALRKAEEQLRHAQKMEAVGRLAGSVAHDFNNQLSVILGYSISALEELKELDPIREDISEIVRAGERASELTRQLLAFSRQQVLNPRVLDLNYQVRDCEKLLRRLLGEDIELVVRCSRTLSKVRADPGQIEQVIMNLVINARDAMPEGGKLTIETSDAMLEESYVSQHFGAASGPHVLLAISDTGTGMDRETQARIFEPFFTTKALGKGTGLGLSTVFGIVKQSGGNIWVYSEPNGGTTFKVYLPLVTDADVQPNEIVATPVLHGTETILLVEDQDEVRRVAHRILVRFGYHVIEARNAGEALLTCEQYARKIHLLLSDVIMPLLGGRQLAERLLQVRPGLKVLFMSGYTENTIIHHGILDAGVEYVQKPLVPDTLGRRVREVLDSAARPLPPRA